jgi:hypothetical protein
VSTHSTDTISSGDEPQRAPRYARPGPAAPPPGARTTALTAALSLVLAGGVATAAYRTSTDATDPTTMIPASAFAVATLDLGAPGDALGEFAEHFSDAKVTDGEGSAVEQLLRGMFRDTEDPHVDYDKDLAPWLGDHLAVAGWLDEDGQPRVEWLVESTNDTSAREHLETLLPEGQGLLFDSGYAVISSSREQASAALRAAERSSLADTATYAADVTALPNDEALVGWFDGAGAKKALAAAMGGMGSPAELFGDTPFMAFGGNPFQQRVALGLHVTDDYVQADMRTYNASAASAAPSSLVTELPGGTIGAAAFAGADKFVDAMFGMMREFAGIGMGSTDCSGFGSSGSFDSMPVPPLAEIPQGTPNRRELMRAQRRAMRQYVKQLEERPSSPLPLDCGASEPVDPMTELETMTGLSLPGDAKTLLGDQLVVAFGGINVSGPPDVALRSHPIDVDEAERIGIKLAAAVGTAAGFDLFVEQAGSDLVLATSAAYAKRVAAQGTPGEDDAFVAAMGEVPEEISSAAFVDLTRIWPLVAAEGEDVEEAAHLHSFGMWTANDGAVQVAQVRLVAG